jgi:hypothetical protein
MTQQLVKVKDSPELVRDTKSRAILNTDRKALQEFNTQREKILAQRRAQENTEKRLDKLENDIGELKNILLGLVRSNNGN